jgi:hypothetical protein
MIIFDGNHCTVCGIECGATTCYACLTYDPEGQRAFEDNLRYAEECEERMSLKD